MERWKIAVLVCVIACGCEKKLAPPKNDFEAFERKYVAGYKALADGMRKGGRAVDDKDVPTSYRAIYIGASGVWIDRKQVATLAELEIKRVEIVAAIDANAKLLPTIGFIGLQVTLDLENEPASAATSAFRLFADREAYFNERYEDPEVPQRASRILCAKMTILDKPNADKERVVLSLLFEKERAWLGVSRINEFQEIPRRAEDHDFEKIEMTMKEHKASAFFVDRDDMELTVVEGKAIEVIAAVDIACKVGFNHLTVLPREQLSANPSP